MTTTHKLDDKQVQQKLAYLNKSATQPWAINHGKLHKTFRFPDFKAAMAYMQRMTPAIDAMDHHPEWRNIYNRVEVDLVTHSAQGISELDFALAERFEEGAGQGG